MKANERKYRFPTEYFKEGRLRFGLFGESFLYTDRNGEYSLDARGGQRLHFVSVFAGDVGLTLVPDCNLLDRISISKNDTSLTVLFTFCCDVADSDVGPVVQELHHAGTFESAVATTETYAEQHQLPFRWME